MKKLPEEKIVAIIPALNEEATIARVIKVLSDSKRFDEIIVVDGASEDNTAKISEAMGAKVIRETGREGKGAAMKKGLESTDAGIVIFFDADLVGLTKEHIFQLVDPVLGRKRRCAWAQEAIGADCHILLPG